MVEPEAGILGSMYLFPKGLRARILEVARAELGNTDENRYWEEVLDSPPPYPRNAWCGAFALWVLRESGITDRKWTLGKGFLLSEEPKFRLTTDPKPGDIAYYDQPFQHHAIVEAVSPTEVQIIAGNTPTQDVARSIKPRNAGAYFSVEPLLDIGPTLGYVAAAAGVGAALWIYFKKT